MRKIEHYLDIMVIHFIIFNEVVLIKIVYKVYEEEKVIKETIKVLNDTIIKINV